MHRNVRLAVAVLGFVLLSVPFLRAQPEAAIRRVLTDQQEAWNRGDVVTFMRGYADSPQTTFIGKTIQRGYAMILDRYRRNYGSPEAMGHLDFTDLEVRMLGDNHAVVTGHYHLTRSQAGGGDAAGNFSLIFEKEAAGWKIILDHTSS
jgi:uncharacterized protein (TIGR02246 family)